MKKTLLIIAAALVLVSSTTLPTGSKVMPTCPPQGCGTN